MKYLKRGLTMTHLDAHYLTCIFVCIRVTKSHLKKFCPKKKKLRKKVARLFQTPEWMNHIPEELEKFYVGVRPKGKTALLIIEGKKVVFYDKHGG